MHIYKICIHMRAYMYLVLKFKKLDILEDNLTCNSRNNYDI